MRRVLVLGATGMLGAEVAEVLAREPSVEVMATDRTHFDAATGDPGELLAAVRPAWVVNAIGITAPHIDERDPASVERAETVNARFPGRLAEAAAGAGARVLHLSTDGVFSGAAGPYVEDDPPDAEGVYARTKLAGEIRTTLRCSIVGHEPPGGVSLLAWVLSQPEGATLDGFTNHRWNGITTVAFGRLAAGLVREGLELPSPLHVVPADVVSKADLVALLAEAHGRDDLVVRPVDAPQPVDRSLATHHHETVAALWRAAGYDAAPTVAALVSEVARSSRVRDRS